MRKSGVWVNCTQNNLSRWSFLEIKDEGDEPCWMSAGAVGSGLGETCRTLQVSVGYVYQVGKIHSRGARPAGHECDWGGG